jgi:uncharacterized RDD family membrane protein YckC
MKQPAGLLRRLGAILYDALLLLALFFLATIPFIALASGEAVNPETLLYQVILIAVAYAFLVGFWCRRGSTLGMLAWGLRVETVDGSLASPGQGTIRFLVAIVSWVPAGLGFWWQLWDKNNCTWHDRASGTYLMYYPKKKQ